MNSKTKTTYLIGVGASLAALAGIVTINHAAKVAEDEEFARSQNQNTNQANQSIVNQNANTQSSTQSNANTQSTHTNVNTNASTQQQSTNTQVNSNAQTNVNTSTSPSTADQNVNTSTATSGANGTFTTSVTYSVPEGGTESCDVSVTLVNNIITSSSVSCVATRSDSRRYQSAFINAYKTQVTGKSITAVRLSRVGGATLTTNAFNTAISKIQSQL